MSFFGFIKEKHNENLDAPSTSVHHREIVLRKQFLKKLYIEWYNKFLDLLGGLPDGIIVEIGSGGGFIKDLNPEIITSDIIEIPGCDFIFPGHEMPFENNSISGIFMLDVLHHIPNTRDFFKEASRCLKPGGIIFMIEPANTLLSRFIYKNFHHEPFMPEAKDWHFPSSGPLSDANGAIPWIIFNRDIEIFRSLFPGFSVKEISMHTPFRYLITGGLSYKSLVPGYSFGCITFLEKIFKPFYKYIGMFQTIQIQKI